MKPTDKSPELERDINAIFGFNRKSTIQSNMCVPKPIGCGQPVGEFKDELSRREYKISGLCPKCQIKIFGY